MPDALLWPAADGVANLRQSTFARHWKNAREAAGRPDLPLHALRHYAAAHYAAAGATETEVMERLGQGSPGIARRYISGTGREAALVEALDAAARTA
ncbi:tyrosine-type recombinase/integrase [Microbacterium lacticum]